MADDASKEPGLWSHHVPNQSPALVITSMLFLFVTTVFFALRVEERWRRRPRESNLTSNSGKIRAFFLSDDFMAAAAYITLVVQTIFGGLAAHYGFGKHRASIPSTFPRAMLYFYLYQICYKILGGLTKLTFCFLYRKVFVYTTPDGLYQTHFNKLVIITAGVTAAGTFAFTVGTIFQCTPVNRAWDRRVPGHCTDNLSFWFSHAAFNTIMDIIVFILPLPVISGIAAARKIRVGLMSTFALGAFVIAASIARMVNLRGSASSTADPTWGSMPALIWTEVEANTAVIVCCCPALPALVKQLWRKVRKMIGQSVSLDSGTPPKPPSNQDPEPYYVAGNLSYAHCGNQKGTRWPWFGSRKQQGNNSWAEGDEELSVLPPVSRLAPKLRSGRIFKKKPDVEAGPIYQHTDVMLSTHRRSTIEKQDDDRERAEFTRQNTERQGYHDRKLDRHLNNTGVPDKDVLQGRRK